MNIFQVVVSESLPSFSPIINEVQPTQSKEIKKEGKQPNLYKAKTVGIFYGETSGQE